MAGAKLEKTRWPGIYRRGDRYVVVYRDRDGTQRRETVRTLDQARSLSPGGKRTKRTPRAGSCSLSTLANGSSDTRRATPRATTTGATSTAGSSRSSARNENSRTSRRCSSTSSSRTSGALRP